MSEQYIERTFREVNSRTDVAGANFNKGVKDFKFSIGQGYGFIPNQSYFRVTLKLTVGGEAPTLLDTVAFADNCCGNLFNNIYFNMGGQTVSQITNGVPQIEIIKSRLSKNPVYNASIGVAQGLAGHYYDRRKLLLPPTAVLGGNPLEISLEDDDKQKFNINKNTRDFI